MTDLVSKNGTYANEVAIVEAFLWGGETLRLGGTSFRVEIDDEVATTPISDATCFGRVVGVSREMRRLYPFFAQLARSSLPLLIEGDTGTGKELLAESIHEASPSSQGPFVVFDSAQDPELLGIFEQADGGTVFLDEVGELDAQLQRKLLRLLERANVRVMASTRLDLDKLVQDGAFREDLYYRLVVSRVELPPLRKRTGDVAELARHFWKELGGQGAPSSALLAQLARHPWPGNVRELKNRIARLVAKDLPLARARELVVNEFEKTLPSRSNASRTFPFFSSLTSDTSAAGSSSPVESAGSEHAKKRPETKAAAARIGRTFMGARAATVVPLAIAQTAQDGRRRPRKSAGKRGAISEIAPRLISRI